MYGDFESHKLTGTSKNTQQSMQRQESLARTPSNMTPQITPDNSPAKKRTYEDPSPAKKGTYEDLFPRYYSGLFHQSSGLSHQPSRILDINEVSIDKSTYLKLASSFKSNKPFHKNGQIYPLSKGSFGSVSYSYNNANKDFLIPNTENSIKNMCNILSGTCYVEKLMEINNNNKIESLKNEINILKILNNDKTKDHIISLRLSGELHEIILSGKEKICEFYFYETDKSRREDESKIKEDETIKAKKYFITMAYYPSTLSSISKNMKLSIAGKLKIIRQILCGLTYMHILNISHNDLKMDNIAVMLDGNKLITKILDFGGARILMNNVSNYITNTDVFEFKNLTMTITTCDPHLLNSQYHLKNDIWSVACILFELLTGMNLTLLFLHAMEFKHTMKNEINNHVYEYFEKYGFDKQHILNYVKINDELYESDKINLQAYISTYGNRTHGVDNAQSTLLFLLNSNSESSHFFHALKNFCLDKHVHDKDINSRLKKLFDKMFEMNYDNRYSAKECILEINQILNII